MNDVCCEVAVTGDLIWRHLTIYLLFNVSFWNRFCETKKQIKSHVDIFRTAGGRSGQAGLRMRPDVCLSRLACLRAEILEYQNIFDNIIHIQSLSLRITLYSQDMKLRCSTLVSCPTFNSSYIYLMFKNGKWNSRDVGSFPATTRS